MSYDAFNNELDLIEQELAHLRKSRNLILTQSLDAKGYYPDFLENKPFARSSIVYNPEDNMYYFLHGPSDSMGIKKLPVIAPLEETVPEQYINTSQLVNYTYIVEIIDPSHWKIFEPTAAQLPETPFYFYVIQLDDNDPKFPRVVAKVKVTELIIDVITVESIELHIDQIFATTENYPMLGFYSIAQDMDHLTVEDFNHPPEGQELQIPLVSMWQQWTFRPHSYHQINPMNAWCYTNVYGWSWGFPIPYPEYTYDWRIDPPRQYGYETARDFENHRLVYNMAANNWKINGVEMLPFARSLAHLQDINEGFGKSGNKFYYKFLDGTNKRLAVNVLD